MRALVLLSLALPLVGCTAEQNEARERWGTALQGAGAGLQTINANPAPLPQKRTVCPEDGGPCSTYIVHER